ncbi:hypothetical protein [Microcoleus sp. N9_A1]|uniref:hypothetical protein n=1 Tax=Microcoleus sp. N9_A1 TaxID=3055380 RepID=UPI002FD7570C
MAKRFQLLTTFMVTATLYATGFSLTLESAYAGCNSGLGRLDPTCPGRPLGRPSNGGTAPSKIPTQVDTRPVNRQCPGTYSKEAFRGGTGNVAFFNEWSTPVTVVLYHPSNGQIFNRYTVPPKQNNFLGNNVIIGDDWGVCFENKPGSSGVVNNAGSISDYNPNWQGNTLFMIQNPRIR